MDITSVVNYEFLYKLDIKHPVTDAPFGITMMIRSAASEVAKEIQRKHADKHIERRLRNKLIKGAQVEQETLEEAASFVASWEWGINPATKTQNTFRDEVPDLTMKKAMEIFEAVPWIFQQVREAANSTENFSETSQTA